MASYQETSRGQSPFFQNIPSTVGRGRGRGNSQTPPGTGTETPDMVLFFKPKLDLKVIRKKTLSLDEQLEELQNVVASYKSENVNVYKELAQVKETNINLVEEVQKRRAEIMKLKGELKSLSEETKAAKEEKDLAIAALEAAKMQESNMQHKITRLEHEKNLLIRQITELHEDANDEVDLKIQLEKQTFKVHVLEGSMDFVKRSLLLKDEKIAQLENQIHEMNLYHSECKKQIDKQIAEKAKLLKLHEMAGREIQDRMKDFEQYQASFEASIEDIMKKLNESSM